MGVSVLQQAPRVLPRSLKRTAMSADDRLIPPQHLFIVHGVPVHPAYHDPGLVGMILWQGQKHQSGILCQHRQIGEGMPCPGFLNGISLSDAGMLRFDIRKTKFSMGHTAHPCIPQQLLDQFQLAGVIGADQ